MEAKHGCSAIYLLALVAVAVTGCRHKPLPPPEIGMWYWHSPFRLTDADRQGLRDIGVSNLYVRAGTFASDGKTVSLIQPQKWESKPGNLGTVLTYNFHPGLVKHLEDLPTERVAQDVADRVERSWREARDANPKGVQFDMDCPTRLLPRYAEILTGIRARLKANGIAGSFSSTALPTWLTSKNIGSLAAAVDFLAPQFYEGRTGKTAGEVFPVSDPSQIEDGLRRIARLGIPCQAGIATYDHALLYDDHQQLIAMYHGLSPEDALRHPSLTPISSVPLTPGGHPARNPSEAVGEDRLVLRAIRADARGKGKDFRIAYLLPTPAMVTRQLAAFRAERPECVKGLILYRFPEPGEAMSLPLESIAAGMRGDPLTVGVKVTLSSRSVPWTLIDAKSSGTTPPREVTIRLQATGNTATQASRQGLQVLVTFDRPGIDGVAPGDFDEAEAGILDDDGRFTKCAPIRADAVRFRRYHLLPGDSLRSGAILLPADGATQAWTRWAAQGPGGFQTFSGESSKTSLTSKP